MNFIEVFAQASNWQQVSVEEGNVLSSNRCQAIIWTTADPDHWRK